MEKVFSALADANRRKIIELLHKKDSTLLELSKNFSVSFQALSKHIKILEEANIINKKRVGKYKVLSLNRSPFREALEWISYHADFWEDSFDKLDELINRQDTDGESQ